MSQVCKSLSDLMDEAFYLSFQVGYSEITPNGYYFTWRNNLESLIGEKHTDTITAWVDGLKHKYYENVSSGKCSMSEMINFDVEKWEGNVKINIAMMTDVLKRVGPPKQLTFIEM